MIKPEEIPNFLPEDLVDVLKAINTEAQTESSDYN